MGLSRSVSEIDGDLSRKVFFYPIVFNGRVQGVLLGIL